MALQKVAPSRLQQLGALVLAACLVAAGVWGGQWFSDSDYVYYGISVSIWYIVSEDCALDSSCKHWPLERE